ncbi:MAG TPA: VOC family protein [Ktedonobacterales bacterium]|nr:VOC family protein [Ktedonobacterales bacterium]
MADTNEGIYFAGTQSITPHVVVRGAALAADWYKQALGAKELGQRIAAPGGKFMHIDLWFGDSAVMLADEFPEMNILSPQSVGGTSVVLMLATDDVDALWLRAVAAGATIFHPLQDQFWGDRQGQIIDPFGHRWGLAQHIRDVPPDEIARAAEAFGKS